MTTCKLFLAALAAGILSSTASVKADNPVIMDQYTADPTARFFNGKIYLYPSHDMPSAKTARGGQGWFAMEDYHVFSTENLIDWKDNGVILDQKQVPWVQGAANSMWAPDCVERDGKFYFYFPASNRIGVAIADKPEGPFVLQPTAIVGGIDPCCFIDWNKYKKDVAAATDAAAKAAIKPDAYLVWKGNPLSIRKLADDMKSLDPNSQQINVQLGNVPKPAAGATMAPAVDANSLFFIAAPGAPAATAPQTAPGAGGRAGGRGRGPGGPGGGGGGNAGGLIEGPFMFERNGIYYLTYPHAIRDAGFESEALEYAMGPSPTGPFKVTGTIMDQTANHCWTNHHSFVEYQGKWMLFYHDKDLSPDFDKDRSVRADYVTFNDDGTINKVIPTLRGVGVANAKNKVQIDRYSDVSKTGTAVAFVNPEKTFDGWYVELSDKNAWVKYDRVDFGKDALKAVKVRAKTSDGTKLEIHLDKTDGPVVATIDIPKGAGWGEVNAKLSNAPTGQHDLVVTMPDKNNVQIDWVSFE